MRWNLCDVLAQSSEKSNSLPAVEWYETCVIGGASPNQSISLAFPYRDEPADQVEQRTPQESLEIDSTDCIVNLSSETHHKELPIATYGAALVAESKLNIAPKARKSQFGETG